MLNIIIYVATAVVGVAGISVAVWSIMDTRRKHPSAKRLDRTAEKVYLAVVDFIATTHSRELPLEAVQPFDKLSEPLKDMYRDLAKRHFL